MQMVDESWLSLIWECETYMVQFSNPSKYLSLIMKYACHTLSLDNSLDNNDFWMIN